MNRSPSSNRASRPGRILQFPVTRIVLGLVAVILSVLVAQFVAGLLPFDGETDWSGRVRLTQPLVSALPFALALQAVLSAGATILFSYGAFYAYARFVERRNLTELAPAGALKELGSGILVGALLFTGTILVLSVLGFYEVSGSNDWAVLVVSLAGAAISGFVEEILFRGIVFKIVEESLGTWLALLISATLFGLLHLGNPNVTLVGALAIVVEAGVLLAAAYMLTRRLWLAIGLHFAWNFTQTGIFGLGGTAGLLRANLTGPAWLSGGEFGPEASVVALVLCLAVAIYFVVRSIRQNHILRPFWRRAPRA